MTPGDKVIRWRVSPVAAQSFASGPWLSTLGAPGTDSLLAFGRAGAWGAESRGSYLVMSMQGRQAAGHVPALSCSLGTCCTNSDHECAEAAYMQVP